METSITIKSDVRTANGKGPARRLRLSGKVPATVYGPGHTSESVAVDPKDLLQVLHAPLGRNTVFTLNIGSKAQLAMLKSFEYHPLSREIEHADFYTVQLERPIIVEVPFVTTGRAKGVATGGILREIYRRVRVKCTPDKIPSKLEIDVTELELGAALHARDLVLPAGVTVLLDPGQTIVAVVAPEKEEKAAEAAPAAAAAAPGAAAAPAAGAAAPAAGKAPAGAAPAAGAAKAPAAPAKDAKKK